MGTSRGGTAKIITVVLCQDEVYKTDGTTTYLVDLFDVPTVREYGPLISQLRVHYACEGGTTNFVARVTSAWSLLGRSWSSPTVILGDQQGTQTGVISAYLATPGAFGILMRYAVEVKNFTGAATESGRVTIILEIELKS